MQDPEVIGLANEVMGMGLSLMSNMDAIVAHVSEHAARYYDEPRASWFVADVLNEINEREMALEG